MELNRPFLVIQIPFSFLKSPFRKKRPHTSPLLTPTLRHNRGKQETTIYIQVAPCKYKIGKNDDRGVVGKRRAHWRCEESAGGPQRDVA